ncbi:hypothetical protein [Alkalibacterium sp. 20]|uniref:hypothetical protein n=1 Tax=Alkalibacterium sp. 20 TaxID=1798803 RepID=UPI0009004585|nr:hypothetical protein [Alkalibacterium sp. 20]OJF91131.1 hypothetical protein AX762_11280 [Alkalibacterium sp. 20]
MTILSISIEEEEGDIKNETNTIGDKNNAILIIEVTREKWNDPLVIFPTIYEKENRGYKKL